MGTLSKFASTAALALATTLVLSCSSGSGGSNSSGDDPSGGDPSSPSGSGSGSFNYGSLQYEGQTYKTIEIGTQVWMAENLNYNASGSKCYNDEAANCTKYGRLYDWVTAMGLDENCSESECAGQISEPNKGICPDGWHIPSYDEFNMLIDNAGGEEEAANHLKATSGWYEDGNGTDDYGFAALPGGFRNSSGSFIYIDVYGSWWSASEYSDKRAYYRYISGDIMGSQRSDGKLNMFSVRCIKD